jgi:hypothetical protein
MSGSEDSNGMQDSKPHSGFGVSSFAIAVTGFLAAFALFAVAAYMEASTEGGMPEDSPEAIVVGLMILALCFVFVLGIALGIAGVVQNSKRRVFGIIGLVCNTGSLVLVVAMIVIGSQL